MTHSFRATAAQRRSPLLLMPLDSFIWLIHMPYSYDAFIWLAHMTCSYDSFIWWLVICTSRTSVHMNARHTNKSYGSFIWLVHMTRHMNEPYERAIWLIRMTRSYTTRRMNEPYEWVISISHMNEPYDLFVWLIYMTTRHMAHMTHSYNSWHMAHMTHSCDSWLIQTSFRLVIWTSHMNEWHEWVISTHDSCSYMWHGSFIYVTICGMTHSFLATAAERCSPLLSVRHDSFIWLIHICDMTRSCS